MPLLTKGKTNWGYILIVVILTILVGVGIWKYLNIWKKEMISISQFPEIKKREKPEKGVSKVEEKAKIESISENWNVYKSEKYGFEFEYPKEWGEIKLESLENEVFTFKSPNQKIKEILYHKPLQNLFFVETFRKGGYISQDTLKMISKDRKIKTIYPPTSRIAPYDIEAIKDIYLSPNGKYISFVFIYWGERCLPIMINLETGKNIFEKLPIGFCGDTKKSIFWSPNNKTLAVWSQGMDMGVFGIKAVFISDYGNPDKLNEVFSERILRGKGKPYYFDVMEVRFIDDENFYFEVKEWKTGIEKYIEKYIYNARTKELKKL
jgi:hypothetical protein